LKHLEVYLKHLLLQEEKEGFLVLDTLAGDLGGLALYLLAHLLGGGGTDLNFLLHGGLHRYLLADLLGLLLALGVTVAAGFSLSLTLPVVGTELRDEVDRLADLDLLALSLLIGQILSYHLGLGGAGLVALQPAHRGRDGLQLLLARRPVRTESVETISGDQTD